MKRALVALLGLVLLVALCGCHTPPPGIPIAPFFAEGHYTYTVMDGTASIRKFADSYVGALSITNMLGGYPVTSIDDSAFFDRTNLTSIAIPSGVTSIGQSAFACCLGLTNITIPASVTRISDGAFSNCANLQRVYFVGNAPAPGDDVFGFTPATIYYRPGTTGWGTADWGPTYCDRPTAVWLPDATSPTGKPVPAPPTVPQP